MCMIDAGEGCCIVLHERHQRARKGHSCSECGRAIRAGEQYMVERTIWEGSASTVKTCRHCQVARKWLQKECGGWIYGGVYEDISEHAWDESYYGVGVKMLSVGMSRSWTKKNGDLWRVPSVPKIPERKAAKEGSK
jgi:hypothetical protein